MGGAGNYAADTPTLSITFCLDLEFIFFVTAIGKTGQTTAGTRTTAAATSAGKRRPENTIKA